MLKVLVQAAETQVALRFSSTVSDFDISLYEINDDTKSVCYWSSEVVLHLSNF